MVKLTWPCPLRTTTTEITIKEPKASQEIGIPYPAMGLVQITTEVKPDSLCLEAFGHDRGGFDLQLGTELPAPRPGYYGLTIDNEGYGVLKVNAEGVKLIDWSEIPQ